MPVKIKDLRYYNSNVNKLLYLNEGYFVVNGNVTDTNNIIHFNLDMHEVGSDDIDQALFYDMVEDEYLIYIK